MKLYRRKANITSAKLDSKYSLFIEDKGSYVNLNSTASLIWEFLETEISLDTLKRKILENYDVDDNDLEKDLTITLNEFKKLGIIEINES